MKSIEATLPLGAASWVAHCVDARHPTLQGRVRCAFDGAEPVELWLPTLQGLSIREGDRVLVTKPANAGEPIVVGVVDGFARRPPPQTTTAAKLTLQRDEQILIESASGAALLSLRDSEAGPVARLLHDDVHLEVKGELKVSAKAIALAAREGEATVDAASDVVVRGENIRLN